MTDRTRLPLPDLDWDYRPASYWDHPDPVSAVVAGIKGQERRKAVRDAMNGVPGAELPPEEFRVDSLPPHLRRLVSRLHPAFMGGEYLPDYRRGEVEIARVVLASVMQDVISIRARRVRGRITYRVVDEYPEHGGWSCRRRTTAEPLTLGELIRLIDGAWNGDGGDRGTVLADRFRNANLEAGDDPATIRHFVTVESDLYPELAAYYAWQAEQWYLSVMPEEEDEGGAEQDWVDRT